MPTEVSKRIIGIDVCRSLAIILAMFSHALTAAHMYRFVDPDSLAALRFVLQMAPPVFIILFGAMLEIAYKPRFDRGDGQAATKRLLVRATQCWVLYMVTLVPLVMIGQSTMLYAIRCALLGGVTPFADILKFYAVALALAPLLIQLRRRWGFAPLIISTLVVHWSHVWISSLPSPPAVFGQNYLDPFIGFLIGGGIPNMGGPSLLHGSTFVIWGLLIGNATKKALNGEPSLSKSTLKTLPAMLGVSLLSVVTLWNWTVPLETFIDISNMSLRNANHPIYFACGLAATLIAVAVCLYAYDFKDAKLGRSAVFMGKTSLFTFAFGNALLYLAPKFANGITTAWLYAFVLLTLICTQSYLFQEFQTAIPKHERTLLARAQRLLQFATDRQSIVAGWLSKPYQFALFGNQKRPTPATR